MNFMQAVRHDTVEAFRRAAGPLSAGRRSSVRSALLAACALAATAAYVAYRARQAERKHPPTGRFIEVDGVKLHYLERGDGPPVVLLHGNGAIATDFEGSGVMDRLAARHRVIAFDRPGFGYSERPRKRVWTPHAQAALLARALDQLKVQQPVVVGHSWGTLVALQLAVDFPQRLRGIVLISGYYFPTLRADVFLLSPPAIPLVGDLMRYTISPLISRLIARPTMRKMFSPRPISARFESAVPLPLMIRPSQLRAAAEESGLMSWSAAALKDRYRKLMLPVTIIAGVGDRVADLQRQALRLHQEIPHSELRTEAGIGHMLHYAAPDVVVTAIEDIVAATTPSGSPLAGMPVV
ncbi:MAG TPA: alpha/beta hydrolase [Burkholderiales bacterium]|jgi:pimeloyl-ACP methyl ester carboxylesterase